MRKSLAAVMLSLALCSSALADKVVLLNGDVITGKIESSDGKNLVVKTDEAGEIKIDLKKVKTFSTDQPVEIQLTNGSDFHLQALATTQPTTQPTTQGSVEVEPGVLGPETFTLDRIKAINPPPVVWTGDITAGGTFTRGNSYSDQLHIGYDVQRRGEQDRITSNGMYLYGRQKDPSTGVTSTTVDNWIINGKYDHFVDGTKWYGFVNTLLQKDVIQGLNIRFVPGVGIGYQWFESPTLNLNTEAGLSWIYEDYEDQETTNQVAARLAYHFDKQLGDHLKLINNVEYLPSLEYGEKFLVNADIGLRVDMTQTLFAEGKIVEQYNSQPGPGHHKNDEQYIFSVGWKF